MEIGITTFAETTPDPSTGEVISAEQRLTDLMEEIELADRVGLDAYGVGEHHRPDFAVSAPAIVLAAAAVRTKRIRLGSAVSVLSSDDPVRVFQDFATVDLLSHGRAELVAGRGSFIESFPLFGYSLDDYDALFAEKLGLLLAIRDNEKVTWSGKHRAPIENRGVYPRPVQNPLPVWIAVGGSPNSFARAGRLGLPLSVAILGGQPERFAPLVELYRESAAAAGHDPARLPVSLHTHGFLADTERQAVDQFFPSYAYVMTKLGRERGWPPMTPGRFDAARSKEMVLAVGTP
ncbi:MAG: LLM class flavin-dependent oxidoreductase, partial [Dehalococcoidia bacterium]|nr:LLM class flavin-dependent oxidoreductase [Dehalococcoidia bacterium]